MYGQFVREIPEEKDKDLSWKWLVQSDLKVQTEATIRATQEQALQIIPRIKLARQWKIHCVECVVKWEKLRII